MVTHINRGNEDGRKFEAKVTTKEINIQQGIQETKVAEFENLSEKDGNNSSNELLSDNAEKMTESMNKFLETVNTELRFRFHDKLNTYYVTLINAKTEEIIREIPSKKLMDIFAAMRDFVGLIVDEKI